MNYRNLADKISTSVSKSDKILKNIQKYNENLTGKISKTNYKKDLA